MRTKEGKIEVRVVYEDDLVCVVDKPSGMVVNDAITVNGETLQGWFRNHSQLGTGQGEFWDKGGVVHRLDKETSGVMVLAKTEHAYLFLKDQFLTRQTKKTYKALVHGKMNDEMGVISLPIERHPVYRMKFTVGTDPSRMAITEWNRVAEYEYKKEVYSLLKIHLLTGRTHQIRVHMKHLGRPLVSDYIYSGKRLFERDVLWCPRLFLHAEKLGLRLPSNGEWAEYEVPLPKELQGALDRLC